MGIKSYFEKDVVTTLLFAALGVVVGYASFLISTNAGALVLMLLVAVMTVVVLKKAAKMSEDFRWWLGNGLAVYVLLWLITWAIFYNIGLR